MPNNRIKSYELDDVTIQALFGHEAAEQDDIRRLRQYYFKGTTYKRVTADLPLRILVGQKGIGKSALLSVARSEDIEQGETVLFLRPEDVIGIGNGSGDFIKQIAEWKNAIFELIQELIFENLGISAEERTPALYKTGKVLSMLKNAAKPFLAKYVDQGVVQEEVARHFLKTERVTVYVDDLDRGWDGKRESIKRLAAFLIAIKDLSIDEPGIRFRVAIRSDVFSAIRKSEPDTDKLESSLVWHTWTNHEVLLVLVKRVMTFFDQPIDEVILLKEDQLALSQRLTLVLPKLYLGQGAWTNLPIHRFLMTMVRQRPRDIVKLCSAAARRAAERGSSTILSKDLSDVLEPYSMERIQDVINEHGLEITDLDRLLFNMKPTRRTKTAAESYVYKTDRLLEKLKNISEQGKFFFAAGRPATS